MDLVQHLRSFFRWGLHTATVVLLYAPVVIWLLLNTDCPLWESAYRGLAVGYALAGIMLVVGPTVHAALAGVGQGGSGVGEAPVGPTDLPRLVARRFLRLVSPWLVTIAMMLPAYAVFAVGMSGVLRGGQEGYSHLAFMNKVALGLGMATERMFDPRLNEQMVWWAVVRIANDLSILLLVSAVAYVVSMRFRRPIAAIAVSLGVTGGLLATLLCPDLWNYVITRAGFWVLSRREAEPSLDDLFAPDRWEAEVRLISRLTMYASWGVLLLRLAISGAALKLACTRLGRRTPDDRNVGTPLGPSCEHVGGAR